MDKAMGGEKAKVKIQIKPVLSTTIIRSAEVRRTKISTTPHGWFSTFLN
jgi:hypothetical protein